MATAHTIKEFQSYIQQTKRNLDHYQQRRDDLVRQQEAGKSYINKEGIDLLPGMIAEEEKSVLRYQDILKDLETKLLKAEKDNLLIRK